MVTQEGWEDPTRVVSAASHQSREAPGSPQSWGLKAFQTSKFPGKRGATPSALVMLEVSEYSRFVRLSRTAPVCSWCPWAPRDIHQPHSLLSQVQATSWVCSHVCISMIHTTTWEWSYHERSYHTPEVRGGCTGAGGPRGATPRSRSGGAAMRRYPSSKVRGSGCALLEQPWRDTPCPR